MNAWIKAYMVPADAGKPVAACMLAPHPIQGYEDEVSYLPSMYLRMHCRMVERIACECVPNSCLWVDEEAHMRGEPPPLNVRASILAGREVYGDCILAGDDGQRTVRCDIIRKEEFLSMLNLLASTVGAVLANGKEDTDGRDS